jgi:hypothetical protein
LHFERQSIGEIVTHDFDAIAQDVSPLFLASKMFRITGCSTRGTSTANVLIYLGSAKTGT